MAQLPDGRKRRFQRDPFVRPCTALEEIMIPRRASITATFAVVLCALSCRAQTPGAAAPAQVVSSPSVVTDTQEVLVDLVARDKNGKPVLDLRREDLEITDDGSPVKIKDLRYITGSAATPSKGGQQAAITRVVTLVFENVGNESARLAREAAAEMLRTDPIVVPAVVAKENGAASDASEVPGAALVSGTPTAGPPGVTGAEGTINAAYVIAIVIKPPDERQHLLELLRPPVRCKLDVAVGTTYSLDLISALMLPLSFAFFDWEHEDGELVADPLALLEALRRYEFVGLTTLQRFPKTASSSWGCSRT
jgi:hypothetical protein